MKRKIYVNLFHSKFSLVLGPNLPVNKAPKIVVNMLAELKLHCHNWNHGCEQILSLKQLSSHSEKCEFNPKRKSNLIEESSDEEIEIKAKRRKKWSQSNSWKIK